MDNYLVASVLSKDGPLSPITLKEQISYESLGMSYESLGIPDQCSKRPRWLGANKEKLARKIKISHERAFTYSLHLSTMLFSDQRYDGAEKLVYN